MRGLRARGGYTVDLTWEDGRLTRAAIQPLTTRECTLLEAAGRYAIRVNGQPVPAQADGHRLRFAVEAGRVYEVTPA